MLSLKMIDLRLVFIVFMGSLYGINYGISAAAFGNLFFDCSIQAGECKHIYFVLWRLPTGFRLFFILQQVLSVVI